MSRVAILIRDLDNSGGAEQSMRTLKNHLENTHGLEVRLFGIGSQTQSDKDVTTIPLLSRRRTYLPFAIGSVGRYVEGFARFRQVVKSFNPDIIISQHELALLGAYLKTTTDTPHILFLRDYEMISESFDIDRHFVGRIANRIFWPVTRPMVEYIINNVDTTIANSHFVASAYRKEWDIEPDIVYPFIDVSQYDSCDKGDKILHVTPTRNKGIDLTLAVADRLPDEEFLIVGAKVTSRVREAMMCRKNVTYEGYCKNMREVYRRAKLVLVPSRWHEPFGRIPIEAGASGVPAICSNRGGLPESVADEERIVNSYNSESYIKIMKEVLLRYDEYSKRAQRNAREKRAELQLVKFEKILERVLSASRGP